MSVSDCVMGELIKYHHVQSVLGSLTSQYMRRVLRGVGSGGGSVIVATAVVVLLSGVPIGQHHSPMLA